MAKEHQDDDGFKTFIGKLLASELSGTIVVDGKEYKLPPGYKCADCYTNLTDFKMHACTSCAVHLRQLRDEGKLEEVKP